MSTLSATLFVVLASRLPAAAANTDDEISKVIETFQRAKSLPAAESRAVMGRILSADFVGVSPNGSFESQEEVLARIASRQEQSGEIRDQRVHVFRDESGRERAAVATYASTWESGGTETSSENLYVLQNRGTWVIVAGREMPVTSKFVGAAPVDVNVTDPAPDERSADQPTRELRQLTDRFGWASVPAEPGSTEEKLRMDFVKETMASDYVRIAQDGSAATKEQINFNGNQGVTRITYENVKIHVFDETAITAYRSKYERQRGISYFMLLRVFMKRGGHWEMVAGQGIPVNPAGAN